mgnify:FL=1
MEPEIREGFEAAIRVDQNDGTKILWCNRCGKRIATLRGLPAFHKGVVNEVFRQAADRHLTNHPECIRYYIRRRPENQ